MQDTVFHKDALRSHSIEEFPRVERLVHDILNAVDEVCLERPTLWMEYRLSDKAKDKPRILLQAEAFRHVLQGRTTPIYDGELIVGGTTGKRSGGLMFPEFVQIMLWPELLEIKTRRENSFEITDDEIKRLNEEIFPFWMNENLLQNAMNIWETRWDNSSGKNQLDELTKAYWEEHRHHWEDLKPFEILVKFHFYLLSKANGISHLAANFKSVLENGFDGISAQAEEKLEALKGKTDSDAEEKRNFYKAVTTTCEGIIAFAKNYAKTARKMAEECEDEVRREELMNIAEACEHVPAKPARSFREALQAVWFTQIGIHQENYDMGVSFGRTDQYLYPYYKRDIENRIITREEALELLCCAWIKFTDHVTFTPATGSHFFGGTPSNQAMTIGGLSHHNGDGTNELTLLMLEASAIVKLREPNLSARFHSDSPSQYWRKAVECVKTHRSTPALYNDEVIIESMIKEGIPEEDARNYAVIGCVEATVDGETFGMTGAALINLVSAFQMAVNDGYYPERDEQVGPKTGDPLSFEDFDELVRAFKAQVEFLVMNVVVGNNCLGRSHQQLHPTPYLSSIITGCLDSGKDVTFGGAKRNSSGVTAIGLADVADSLTVIEKLVYKDKKCSMTELLEAVRNNFRKGSFDSISKMVEGITSYGNYKMDEDAELADKNAKLVAGIFCKSVKQYENYRGGKYHPGFWSMTCNVGFGNLMDASPSGRKRGEPFASGITPRGGRDLKGLTKSLLSAANIGTPEISNTLALNERFDPSLTVDHVVAASRAYFFPEGYDAAKSNGSNGMGMQVQYTVADRETLLDAKRNPEKYRDLCVRISGYTAYFVDLIEEVQDEIISRTTHLEDRAKDAAYHPKVPVQPVPKPSKSVLFFKIVDVLTRLIRLKKGFPTMIDRELMSVKILLNVMTGIYEIVSEANPNDFRRNLDGFDATIQFRLRDAHRRELIGSYNRIENGSMKSGYGIVRNPDVTLEFKNPASFFRMMQGNQRQLDSLLSGDLSYQGILPYMARYGYLSALVQPYMDVLQDAKKIDELDQEGQQIALKIIARALVNGISEVVKFDPRVRKLVSRWDRSIVLLDGEKTFLGGVKIHKATSRILTEAPEPDEERIEVHLKNAAGDFKVLNLIGSVWQSLRFYFNIRVKPWRGLNLLRKISFLMLLLFTAFYLKPELTDYEPTQMED